ncbi:MAG: hypothetical protein ACRDJN_21020 [Chloroflexota bacterium]
MLSMQRRLRRAALAVVVSTAGVLGCGPAVRPVTQQDTAAGRPDVSATVQAAVQATTQAGAGPTATPAPAASQASQARPTAPVTKLTNENWGLALADANQHKGTPVELVGKLFLDPQTDGDVTAFQMYTNAQFSDGTTIVGMRSGPQVPKLQRGDYVRVEGVLLEMQEGTNAFGARVRVPLVGAESVEVLPREQVVAPALKTYAVAAPLTQHGLVITLQKVALAAQETRVYVRVQNQSTEKASVSRHQLKLVQGTRQLDPTFSFEANYPDLPSPLLPGIEAETVVLFDAVDADAPLRVVWDGPRLHNFQLTFRPYEWTLPAS